MQFIHNNPIAASLLVSLAINIVFFVVASLFRTDKVTDLSYSLSFLLMAPILLISAGKPANTGSLIVAAAIVIWAIRLGSYLFTRILKIGKDDRFDDKRNDFFKFLRFWILQTITVWIVMLPHSITLTSPDAVFPWYFFIPGLTLFIVGLVIEAISDQQKFVFKNKSENSDRWIDSGLWAYSRHPNYFGEMLLWWGLFLAAAGNLTGWSLLTLLGPLFITLLIRFVSGIPLLEKSAESRHGDSAEYRKYRDSTPLLIPGWKASK